MSSFTAFRAQIYHEDELINHRVSWFAAAQAFFFLVFIQCESPRTSFSPEATKALNGVADLTIVLAPLICVFALTSISAAILKTWKCIREYKAVSGDPEPGMPTLHAFDLTHFSGLVAPILIPLAIFGAWLYLLAVLHKTLAFEISIAAFIVFVCVVALQLRSVLRAEAPPATAIPSRI